MPQTLQSNANALSSADWFKAKLQFELGPVELKHLMEEGKNSLLLLDVRDPESFAKEHIPGAVNIPQPELPKRLSELPKDRTIVCYCWTITCHLATKAALDLAQRDYKVLELVGGIKEWKNGGMSVESGQGQKPEMGQGRGQRPERQHGRGQQQQQGQQPKQAPQEQPRRDPQQESGA